MSTLKSALRGKSGRGGRLAKSGPVPLTVSVTCPSTEVAQDLAKAALTARLVACANILPGVQSLYWWEGKLCNDTEVMLSFKTHSGHRPELAALLAEQHPYDLPAISWTKTGMSKDLADWIDETTGGTNADA